jgi:hypothetical protein
MQRVVTRTVDAAIAGNKVLRSPEGLERRDPRTA